MNKRGRADSDGQTDSQTHRLLCRLANKLGGSSGRKRNLCCVLSQQTTRKFMKEKTAAELRAKQQKLDLVKNIIESSEDASVTPRPPPRETPTPRTRGRPVLPARIQPARSEPNLAAGAPGSTPRAPPRYRAVTSAYAQRTVPRVTTRARSPPPVKPVSGRVWLSVWM